MLRTIIAVLPVAFSCTPTATPGSVAPAATPAHTTAAEGATAPPPTVPLDALAGLPDDTVGELVVEEWARWRVQPCAMARTETRLAVGACLDNEIRIYSRSGDGWTLEGTLEADESEELGKSIAMTDDLLVAGTASGPVLFRRQGSTWSSDPSLPPVHRNNVDAAIAIDDGWIVFGSPFAGPRNPDEYLRGVITLYRFGRTQWETRDVVGPPDAHMFGRALEIQGDTLLIASGTSAMGSGPVYAMRLDDESANLESVSLISRQLQGRGGTTVVSTTGHWIEVLRRQDDGWHATRMRRCGERQVLPTSFTGRWVATGCRSTENEGAGRGRTFEIRVYDTEQPDLGVRGVLVGEENDDDFGHRLALAGDWLATSTHPRTARREEVVLYRIVTARPRESTTPPTVERVVPRCVGDLQIPPAEQGPPPVPATCTGPRCDACRQRSLFDCAQAFLQHVTLLERAETRSQYDPAYERLGRWTCGAGSMHACGALGFLAEVEGQPARAVAWWRYACASRGVDGQNSAVSCMRLPEDPWRQMRSSGPVPSDVELGCD
ncbi:MAG: hypothetical protein AAGF12_24760 [Myxococcota bacterium]